MTKEEQNNIIKSVWTKKLQEKKSIPEDIADMYSTWLRAKIREAVPQLSASQDGGMDNSAEGEAGNVQQSDMGGAGGPPPDQGAGAPPPEEGAA